MLFSCLARNKSLRQTMAPANTHNDQQTVVGKGGEMTFHPLLLEDKQHLKFVGV